jgi:hypothetical protein
MSLISRSSPAFSLNSLLILCSSSSAAGLENVIAIIHFHDFFLGSISLSTILCIRKWVFHVHGPA